MLTLTPGPFVIEDLPLGPRVSDTVSFVALGALLEGVGGQADAVLTPARVHTIDAAGAADLTGAYAAIVAPAEESHAEQAAATPDATIPIAVDAGRAVPYYKAQVSAYLPPPSAGIPTDFIDPPAPPSAYGLSPPVPTGHDKDRPTSSEE